jgi:hypothetical protein
MSRWLSFLLLLGVLVTSGPGLAKRTTQRGKAKQRATFALVLGVNRSVDEELPPLRYADDDAARNFELMSALGARAWLIARLDDNTTRLHAQAAAEAREPTRARFDATVDEVKTAVARAKRRGLETVLYVMYAGHGNVDDGKGYITLEDDRLFGPDVERRLLDRIGAHQTHLIVDACYSFFLAYGRGPSGRRRPLQGFGGLGALADDAKLGLILSTSSAAESHEWEAFQGGVFSHEVRSGLWGAADADGDATISYAELAAFVERANHSVPNERYRPRVHARPPQGATELLRLTGGGRGIEVAGDLDGHWVVEDQLGVRLVDFHNAKQQRITLLRPPRGTLFLRRVGERVEYTLPPSEGVTKVADLTPSPLRAAGRGGAHHAFGQLFGEPFSQEDVVTFTFRPPPLELPEPPREVRQAALAALLKKERSTSVAVLDLQTRRAPDKEMGRLGALAVAEGLAARHEGPVLSMQDVEALLEKNAYNAIIGCDAERCVSDVGSALDVDELVTGRLGHRGRDTLVFLSRLKPDSAEVIARTSQVIGPQDDPLEVLKDTGARLLGPEGRKLGDAPLAEMRFALLVEEVSDGPPVPRRAVEACLQKSLLDQGAPLVDPRQLRRIKSRVDGSLRDVDPLDVVEPEEADVILIATVDYALAVKSDISTNYQGVLSLQLVQVDSGAVIAAETLSARAPGHTPREAITQASKQLCKRTAPVLDAQLKKRSARGSRVVVELLGKSTPTQLAALQKLLERHDAVGRSRVRTTGQEKTTLDLFLSGTDGVGLLLLLGDERLAELGLAVEEASSARLTLRWR